MLALVSPAKKLDFESERPLPQTTAPHFTAQTEELVRGLKAFSKAQIQNLMGLSDKLAELNYLRYQSFPVPFAHAAGTRPAVYAFRGDTYVGLDADTLSTEDIAFAQNHLGILSSLYGLLRPLDAMYPYRLEMGTKLPTSRGEDLYDFWGDAITRACNEATQGHRSRVVVNLASREYIKAVQPDHLDGGFMTCHFKDVKNGVPKVVGLLAKRARGSMARYMIQNRIETPEDLKSFDVNGYVFEPGMSDSTNFVFVRDES